MNFQDKLKELEKIGKGLFATYYYHFETLTGILRAARSTVYHIILQTIPNTDDSIGIDVVGTLARSVLKKNTEKVDGRLHLDHTHSYDLLKSRKSISLGMIEK